MTLILQSPVVMTNPGNAPFIPNTGASIWQEFDMASWTGALNTPVDAVVGVGPAPINERNWSLIRGTGNTRPSVIQESGRKFLRFGGTHSLANVPVSGEERNAPFSFCMLVRVRDWVRPNNDWGILRGAGGFNIGIRLNNTASSLGFMYGTTAPLASPDIATDVSENQWAVMCLAYDVNETRIRVGGTEYRLNTTGNAPIVRNRGFGRNSNATEGAATFDLARYREYTRALQFEDMRLLERQWKLDAGLPL